MYVPYPPLASSCPIQMHHPSRPDLVGALGRTLSALRLGSKTGRHELGRRVSGECSGEGEVHRRARQAVSRRFKRFILSPEPPASRARPRSLRQRAGWGRGSPVGSMAPLREVRGRSELVVDRDEARWKRWSRQIIVGVAAASRRGSGKVVNEQIETRYQRHNARSARSAQSSKERDCCVVCTFAYVSRSRSAKRMGGILVVGLARVYREMTESPMDVIAVAPRATVNTPHKLTCTKGRQCAKG
ncbi:hypothetical protein BC628DRAFT_64480 [Trametes gibbosa]|nr:hypothetical protein BC628DRAFT_64480 [Trametes gibbosa]